ncbi:MAG: hypothetical protein IJA38_02280 [Bacteroidales bacterium]|nr:hypothetical protein [Bacteroidales bacterium]
MKRILYALFLVMLCTNVFAQHKQDLRVLYVGGSTDSSDDSRSKTVDPNAVKIRMAAFEECLKQYFTEVAAIVGSEYKEEMSANYDVTIFDGKIPVKQSRIIRKGANGETNYHAELRLSEDFEYPTLLIAEAGEDIGRSIGLKTDWYCLCLDADAHHMNLDHPIFKGPFETTITIEEKPTPEDAFHYEYYTGKLPATTPMWKVQTKGYKTHEGFRVGMVSRPWGFADSPDTEIISSGVCAKTIDAVAIGRHGNFFFWGFAASPSYMTDEAKDVFANAVVYTASLKGQRVIARKYYDRAATKAYLKENIYLSSEDVYKERIKSDKEWYAQQAEEKKKALEKKNKGEKLTKKEEYVLTIPTREYQPQPFEKYLEKYMQDAFKIFGTDYKAYHKYMYKNEPYLYGAAMFYKFIVDEDARKWGIANSDIRILDKAISVLEKGKNKEECDRAKRILDRYTLCTFTDPAQWRNWFETYKDKIFFTEAGGYLFLVNTLDNTVPGNDYRAKRLQQAIDSINLPETSDNEPVATGAKHITIEGGKQFIIVKLGIRTGYHIYGNVSDQDPYIPTKVELVLPDGYTQAEVLAPFGTPLGTNGTTQYEDEATFIIPIYGDAKDGIKVKVSYQCCDSSICFPPTEKTIELPSA